MKPAKGNPPAAKRDPGQHSRHGLAERRKQPLHCSERAIRRQRAEKRSKTSCRQNRSMISGQKTLPKNTVEDDLAVIQNGGKRRQAEETQVDHYRQRILGRDHQDTHPQFNRER
jgi:hypothetical protein